LTHLATMLDVRKGPSQVCERLTSSCIDLV
jgi:hypothetical protein